jgi:hypothetical protein
MLSWCCKRESMVVFMLIYMGSFTFTVIYDLHVVRSDLATCL